MLKPWHELTQITCGRPFFIEKVRLADNDIAIEGKFAVPDLAMLSFEDQVFITAFIKTEGSIKEMEKIFGISYPSVKARLQKISKALPFIDVINEIDGTKPTEKKLEKTPKNKRIIQELQSGRISAEEAVRRIKAP